MINTFGLILNVFGSIAFLIDNYRLSGRMASMIHHISEDHGRFDSKKFTREELEDLSKKITQSKIWSLCGAILFILGFLLQLVSATL